MQWLFCQGHQILTRVFHKNQPTWPPSSKGHKDWTVLSSNMEIDKIACRELWHFGWQKLTQFPALWPHKPPLQNDSSTSPLNPEVCPSQFPVLWADPSSWAPSPVSLSLSVWRSACRLSFVPPPFDNSALASQPFFLWVSAMCRLEFQLKMFSVAGLIIVPWRPRHSYFFLGK
jgi:hypothetical protein